MRKIRRLITALIISALWVVPTFADIDSDIQNARRSINDHIEKVGIQTVGQNYPVGSIYTTVDDIDVEYMEDNFGGEWREINASFLWATDATDKTPVPTTIDDDGNETVDMSVDSWLSNLHRFGAYGGSRYYNLRAGIGSDGNGFSFWTDDDTEFLGESRIFTGESYTPGTINSGVLITDKDSEEGAVEIMPPFTKVKMFEKVSNGGDDEEG